LAAKIGAQVQNATMVPFGSEQFESINKALNYRTHSILRNLFPPKAWEEVGAQA